MTNPRHAASAFEIRTANYARTTFDRKPRKVVFFGASFKRALRKSGLRVLAALSASNTPQFFVSPRRGISRPS